MAKYRSSTGFVLDEIDRIAGDTNYDPSEFLYRLLRGEGKLAREIQLSAWLISNELIEVDLRLDSRVESAMSDETVFFPPYDRAALSEGIGPSSTGRSAMAPCPRRCVTMWWARPPWSPIACITGWASSRTERSSGFGVRVTNRYAVGNSVVINAGIPGR